MAQEKRKSDLQDEVEVVQEVFRRDHKERRLSPCSIQSFGLQRTVRRNYVEKWMFA